MKALPYLIAFASSFVLTFILTPLVREMNRRLGMVDKPGARRINTIPVPRGGGLALVIGVIAACAIVALQYGRLGTASDTGIDVATFSKLGVLAASIAAIGYIDDKFSLPPKLKLLGQLVIAALVWFWADLGFHRLWPEINPIVDCAITTFWIAGAINAFNLIDGLDGLASGLALIATIGMAGLFDLPPMATTVCRWIAVWGMVGYVMLSFAFSRASERRSKRRVLASRVVVILVVLVVMMGFVGIAGTLG